MPPNRNHPCLGVEGRITDSEPLIPLASAPAAQSVGRFPVLPGSEEPFHPNPDDRIAHLDFPFDLDKPPEAVSDALGYEEPLTVEMRREQLCWLLGNRYRRSRALSGLCPQLNRPCTARGDSQLAAVCWSFSISSTLPTNAPSKGRRRSVLSPAFQTLYRAKATTAETRFGIGFEPTNAPEGIPCPSEGAELGHLGLPQARRARTGVLPHSCRTALRRHRRSYSRHAGRHISVRYLPFRGGGGWTID